MFKSHIPYDKNTALDRTGRLRDLRERAGLTVYDASFTLTRGYLYASAHACQAAEDGKPVGRLLYDALESLYMGRVQREEAA